MDARLDVYRILGLAEGEAHVIRNAGGVVTDDEIRSLAISQRLLGTKEIILIHHTDCGMLTFTDDDFKKSIQDETGLKPEWAAEAFDDLDEDVRQSLRRIEASPFVTKHESLRGFVFDVATGKLERGHPLAICARKPSLSGRFRAQVTSARHARARVSNASAVRSQNASRSLSPRVMARATVIATRTSNTVSARVSRSSIGVFGHVAESSPTMR